MGLFPLSLARGVGYGAAHLQTLLPADTRTSSEQLMSHRQPTNHKLPSSGGVIPSASLKCYSTTFGRQRICDKPVVEMLCYLIPSLLVFLLVQEGTFLSLFNSC